MGNNQEIRKRMETYRSILLVFNWIVAVVLIIIGIVLANSRYTQGIGIGVIIGSIFIGVIGHFLINVALAIPFILLNNGDYLAAIVPEGKHLGINDTPMDANPEKNLSNRSDQKIDYVVIKSIYLRSMPNLSTSSIIKPLSEGIKVTLLEKGENTMIENIQAPWVKVQDENNNIGWCFSGYLKEV